MVENYNLWMLLIGVACFGAACLPHLLLGKPISSPTVYVAVGAAVFAFPSGLGEPHPMRYPQLAARLTELVVIVALTGAGLKLDRPFGWYRWNSTWRLLGVTMPLCIAAVALAGWSMIGLTPAAALLLGAVLAPTDPVLAANVQVAPPKEGGENEIRFALTSESGLNDGLAFPFTMLAIAMAAAGSAEADIWGEWLWNDVLYQVGGGILSGVVMGAALAWLIFRVRLMSRVAEAGEGSFAIAFTLICYAATNLIQANGFLAVFVAALVFRRFERQANYHKALHDIAENAERLLMAAILVLFGGALATGLLAALTWPAALVGLAFLLIIRPLTGVIGLVGTDVPRDQRLAMAFFGVRGVDSLYLLAFALTEASFAEAELLWATVAFVVLLSIIIHGVTGTPVMQRVEQATD